MPEAYDDSDDEMDSSMEYDAEVVVEEEMGRKRSAERAGYDAADVKRGLRLLLAHERIFGTRLGAEMRVTDAPAQRPRSQQ